MVVIARAIATLPVVDLVRARRFYEGKLGLRLLQAHTNGKYQEALYEAGAGSKVLLYQRPPSKADHTVLAFEVSNIEQTVRDLREKGVTFEEYDMPGLKTANGIATMPNGKAAWFKDSEDNILSLAQIGK